MPPASRTRYLVPAVNCASDAFAAPFLFSTGRCLQNKEAASGSSAMVRLSLSIPAL